MSQLPGVRRGHTAGRHLLYRPDRNHIGSDGILPDSGEAGERMMRKALDEITTAKNEQELMDGVYQEIKLILCGRCRLVFRDRILAMIKY